MNVLQSQTGCSERGKIEQILFLYEHEGIQLEYTKIHENKQAYIEDYFHLRAIFDVDLFILLNFGVLQLDT